MMIPDIWKIVFLLTLRASSSALNQPGDSLPCYLGLDVGTQGTKCLVYCPQEERVVARASVSYGLEPTQVKGRAEQEPSLWIEAVETCLKAVGEQINNRNNKQQGEHAHYDIRGIGVSGQQHGMVALDAAGNPLRPAKLWCDVEATEETQLIQTWAHELNIDRTFLTPGFTAPKILWMKRNEPDQFQQTQWFVLPHDFVTMKLASLAVPLTDAGDASGNGLLDTSARQNIPALANRIDKSLMEKLPQICGPNEVVGHLNNRYRSLLGISPSDERPIPISVGSGDNMCSALGVGCVVPGQAIMSLGTSGTLFGVTRDPCPLNTPLAPFCDSTGQHLPLACTMSCTGVLTQVLKEYCPTGWTHAEASQRLQDLLDQGEVGIGCEGITFLPYTGGERTPNWPHATGALLGLTQQTMAKNTKTNGLLYYRACMEAITFCLADTLQYFPSQRLDKLFVAGGGAKNPLWRQMIADVVQCSLVFPVEAESAALGAAFQAGAAAEGVPVGEYVLKQKIEMEDTTVEPNPNNFEAYQEALQRYRMFGQRLFGHPSAMQS